MKYIRYGSHKYDAFTIDRNSNDSYDSFKFGDFNHDGIEDLLLFGEAEFSNGKTQYIKDEIILLIGGKNRARKMRFTYDYFRYMLTYHVPNAKVVNVVGKDFIQINHMFYNRTTKEVDNFIDTVFVSYDHLIPYTENPQTYEISRIEFRTDYCYGTCPLFEIVMDQNGEVEYHGIDHVVKKGFQRMSIDNGDWKHLETLMDYINIRELNDNYSVNWTDDQTGFLKVTFTNGEQKMIEDYGMIGTYGLSILFDFLFELAGY